MFRCWITIFLSQVISERRQRCNTPVPHLARAWDDTLRASSVYRILRLWDAPATWTFHENFSLLPLPVLVLFINPFFFFYRIQFRYRYRFDDDSAYITLFNICQSGLVLSPSSASSSVFDFFPGVMYCMLCYVMYMISSSVGRKRATVFFLSNR